MADTILSQRQIRGGRDVVSADAEDLVLLRLGTSEGCTVLCESDLITPSYMNYVEAQGDNGSVYTSILEFMPTVVYCREARGIYNNGSNFFEFPRVDLFELELTHFIQAAQSGQQPEHNSLDDSIRLLRVIEQLRERV
jgi:predicted dehydrogenase